MRLDMEDLSLDEKIYLIGNSKKIITPIGSGVINILFKEQDLKSCIIMHPYYKELYDSTISKYIDPIFFSKTEIEGMDSNSMPFNLHYKVNIKEFKNFLLENEFI